MGFNFQTGHPTEVMEPAYGARVAALLTERFGTTLRLGSPGVSFCLPDELGWSWWQELQELAAQRLGPAARRQIGAADAWQAVYIDAEVDRLVLWPEGRPGPGAAGHKVVVAGAAGSPLTRFLRWIGLGRGPARPPQGAEGIMRQMVQDLGPREDEHGGLQVGNLRVLMGELGALLRRLDVEPTESAVDALRRSYADDDDRIDDDPAIQCLCHAWLTGSNALASGSPLWLLK